MTKLEKSMVILKAGVEAEKTVASLAYFEERSEELEAMGVELSTKVREASWSQCKERILALFNAKFPEMDPF